MTIQNNGTRNQYTATSGQTIFPYTFEIFASGDLTVEQNGSVITTYTVSGVGNDAGGNVTLDAGATAGDTITIYRDMDLERLTDYQNNGDFLASEINDDYDRLWSAVQQLETSTQTAIRPSASDTALNSSNTELASIATRANKALAFDSSGGLTYTAGAMPVGTLRNYTGMTALKADVANTTIGDKVYLDEREVGNGGGAWWKVVDATTVTENEYDIVTGDATRSFVLNEHDGVDVRRYGATFDNTPRDIKKILAGSYSPAGLDTDILLQKLRTDYPEFCVYTPVTQDGKEWARWLFTNRFNAGNVGAPRMILASRASLYASTTTNRPTANNVSETRASTVATGFPKASSAGVTVGTWTGPATVLTTTDVIYSSTVGDTITFSGLTGVERLELRGLYAGNGGIAKVTVTQTSGTPAEIAEANYLLPSDHLVNFISTATGDTTMHIPLAEGLDAAETYEVEIEVDSSNPVGGRAYTAGILGYDDVAYNETGLHGTVLDATLDGQSTSLVMNSGTRIVQQVTDATRIKWRYVKVAQNGIAEFKVYDSVGTEVASYTNSTVDGYISGGNQYNITEIVDSLAKGTYYIHAIAGKTKNASATGYRQYHVGFFDYDTTAAGVVGTDQFDNYDVPDNISSPNSGVNNVYLGSGNLELAVSCRTTSEAVGTEEFLGGIHAQETTPTPVYKGDDAVIDFAGAAALDTFTASGFEISFTTTLDTVDTSTNVITAEYTLNLNKEGYFPTTKKTFLTDTYVHHDYSIMFQAPDTNSSGGTYSATMGQDVGGGIKYVSAKNNTAHTLYDDSSVLINEEQESAAFVNPFYMAYCAYTDRPTLKELVENIPGCVTSSYFSLVQDRSDNQIKFYTRAYNCDPTNGVLVPSGTSYSHSKHYGIRKGNFIGLFGSYT